MVCIYKAAVDVDDRVIIGRKLFYFAFDVRDNVVFVRLAGVVQHNVENKIGVSLTDHHSEIVH